MSHRAEKSFSAPPEVVFNVATDPDRLFRWLPERLRVRDMGTECLRVMWTDRPGQEGNLTEYRLVVLPERLRVEFRPAGPDGWSGYLQVRESPAGGSTAEACVAATGRAGESRGADQVAKILDSTLVSLRSEVADNLSDGKFTPAVPTDGAPGDERCPPNRDE